MIRRALVLSLAAAAVSACSETSTQPPPFDGGSTDTGPAVDRGVVTDNGRVDTGAPTDAPPIPDDAPTCT
ncbi:MAG: hypothetical protein KA978_28575, partial [Deltaproteobacteria bacterium]|nr:hypothetical protein [Deltaproteobacteria bacterium]